MEPNATEVMTTIGVTETTHSVENATEVITTTHSMENVTEMITTQSTPTCEDSCKFAPTLLTSSNFKQWPRKCETVCASLHIGIETDLSETQLTAAFKNMKTLMGSLTIMRTKFSSARFLAGLERIICDDSTFMVLLNPKMIELGMTNLSFISCRIHIASNTNMTRLNVPNLKTIIPLSPNNTYMDIDIHLLSPDFCISIQEMNNFLDNMDVRLDSIPGRYCEVDTSPNATDKICANTTSLSQLESGCVQIMGDVIVASGDEEHVEKLETVKSIFGSLMIDGTNLTDVDFLGDLEYVAALEEDTAAIQIQYNPQLSNVSFPSLKRVRSDTPFSVVFLNNSGELLVNPTMCYSIRASLNTDKNYSPTFDGENCEWVALNAKYQAAKKGSQGWNLLVFIVLLAALL